MQVKLGELGRKITLGGAGSATDGYSDDTTLVNIVYRLHVAFKILQSHFAVTLGRIILLTCKAVSREDLSTLNAGTGLVGLVTSFLNE